MELIVRFDYGSVTPWVRATGDGLVMEAGQDGLRFHSPVPLRGTNNTTVALLNVRAGEKHSFSLTYFTSDATEPLPVNSLAALIRTRRWWRDWVSRCTYTGDRRDEVIRSLITLKALTDDRTGAVCAAATTSLPESLGGVRNWDYRYSWLRDATLTLEALLITGYTDEAARWARWLRRAVAGSPGEFQIMYGVGGERRLSEFELDYLPGYEGSKPVRIGNQASTQFQLDVFGELMDSAVTSARTSLLIDVDWGPDLLLALLDHLESVWEQPDDGIWEVRGPRRHFTHSKVMAWVAFDRAIALARDFHVLPAEQVAHWTETRERIHADVCEKGFDVELNSFIQYYGSKVLDASLLMLAIVGFLPPDEPPHRGHSGRHPKGAGPGRLRAALPDRSRPRRRPSWHGRSVPDDHVLAGRQPGAHGTARRGARHLRPAVRAPERRGPPLGGIRSRDGTHARQLPPGLFARGARQHGSQPVHGRPRPLGRAPAQRRLGHPPGARTGVNPPAMGTLRVE